MSLLGQIRDGLAANLSVIDGAQVSGYLLSNPTPPCFDIFPDPDVGIEYHRAFANGVSKWTMKVRGMAGGADDVGSQRLLDAWLDTSGAQSVFAALEAEKTLGGIAADLVVTECTGYQEYINQVQNSTLFAAVWTVEVTLT